MDKLNYKNAMDYREMVKKFHKKYQKDIEREAVKNKKKKGKKGKRR